MNKLRVLLLEKGGLVGLLTLVLYVWVAPSHVVDGDNAEFVTLGALGGAAHPSGYPLYVLWLRAWSWLPVGSPAHRAAIATAILAAASLVALHAACRAWGARAGAATASVLMLAGAPVILAMYTEAEVFALNGLALALVLWLAAAAPSGSATRSSGGPVQGVMRAALLGLVAGLGLSNHLTCAMLAPVGVLGVVRGARESKWRPALAAAAGGLVVGLLPYLYLLVAPVHQGTWGGDRSLGDIVHRILRQDYGGPGAFSASGTTTFPVANLWALCATILRSYCWVPALGGVAMLLVRCVKREPTGEPRVGWWALAASLALCGPLLVLRFNLSPDGVGVYVVERFHLMPLVLLAIPVALAWERAFALADGRAWRARFARPAFHGVVATVGFAAIAGLSLPHLLRAHVPAVEYEVRNTLESLPPNSVVVAAADDLHSGTAYLQTVEGVRRDVIYVQWPLMSLPWYRARIAARGVTTEGGQDRVASVSLVQQALATGHPVFADLLQRNIHAAFRYYPYGLLMRIVPPGEPVPDPLAVLALNKAVFSKFEMPYPRPSNTDEWPAIVHHKYALVWELIAKELARAGHAEDAAWATEAAREYAPTP